jgi:hypothetical protein
VAPLDVTVAVVPRERFSLTGRSLQNLYAHTTDPFNLVYVSAGAPSSVQRYLQDEADRRGFRLLGTSRLLSPNQARNLAMQAVSTKYVVFLDNDALVTPHWLERLVRCAEDTGAWVVGPLYLIGEIEQQTIHMAGGTLHFKEREGRRIAYDEHRLGDVDLKAVAESLQRQRCDFVEFHCMLVRTDALDQLGPLDEQLLSVHEHIDIGWAARQAGGSVYLEPSAIASYVPPPPFEWSDLPYFMLRWSDDWTKASIEHFSRKWGVATTRHFGDEDSSLELEDTAIRFARAHRRLAAGLHIPGGWNDDIDSTVVQSQLMIGLLLSVDRDRFDLTLTTGEDAQVEAATDLNAERVLEDLPALMKRAHTDRLNALIRPRSRRRLNEPALVRVDLDSETLKQVEPHGFMSLQIGPDSYQVWLAVDTSTWRSASLVRRLSSTAMSRSTTFTRLAGSPALEPDSTTHLPCVKLRKGVAGSITTGMDLDAAGVLPHLWSIQIY